MVKGNYQLLFNTKYVDYNGNESVEIAKIVDLQTNQDAIYVVYEKNLYRARGYHTCIDIYENDEREYPVVKMDDQHRKCLLDAPDIFITMMLHELGHYLNGDFNREYASDKEVQEKRTSCILAGKIQEEELMADAFAIKQVGKNTFNRTMDYLIRARQKRNDEGMQLAIKEFELRKKAAKKL